jgi:hypothetical protein
MDENIRFVKIRENMEAHYEAMKDDLRKSAASESLDVEISEDRSNMTHVRTGPFVFSFKRGGDQVGFYDGDEAAKTAFSLSFFRGCNVNSDRYLRISADALSKIKKQCEKIYAYRLEMAWLDEIVRREGRVLLEQARTEAGSFEHASSSNART